MVGTQIFANDVQITTDAVIATGRKHLFIDYLYWPRLEFVEQYRTHHCLVDHLLCVQ